METMQMIYTVIGVVALVSAFGKVIDFIESDEPIFYSKKNKRHRAR